MRNVLWLLMISSALSIAPSVSAADKQAQPECASNFSSSGNYIRGKQFSTHALLPDVRAEAAYKGAYEFIDKKGGYLTVRGDKKAGAIYASHSVAMSVRTAPLHVTITPEGKGSKINITFSISTGMLTSKKSVREQFCKITNAAAGG